MYRNLFLSAVATAGLTYAQGGGDPTLTDLIGSTDSLSSLGALLEAYPSIAESLAGLTNVTLFAPNNAAISALQKTGVLSNITEDQIAAVLNYHVVPGQLESSDITETITFLPTALDDAAYETVTGGQVVGVFLDGQDAKVLSGLKSESTIVTAVSLNHLRKNRDSL